MNKADEKTRGPGLSYAPAFLCLEFPRRTPLGKEGELLIQLFWEARILSLLQAGEP
jgi:hypothetical protein